MFTLALAMWEWMSMRAGHDDLAGQVIGLHGTACRSLDDAVAVDPDVLHAVAAVLRIDDAAALQPDHGSRAAMRSRASATLGTPVGAVAATRTSVPIRRS